MPPGLPDPQAVLRGHKGEVQALDFDEDERCLLSGDSLGEVRVWDLQDLRPAAIRRLHPLSGGVLSLRLFRSSGRRLLGTQGRDGATMLWACEGTGADLQLSEEPVGSFVRDCYSFCRFDVLCAGAAAEAPCGSSGRGGSGSGSCAAQQQGQELAEAFLQSVLRDEPPSPDADKGPDPAASQSKQQDVQPVACTAGGQGVSSDEQHESPAAAALPPTAAESPGDAAGAGPACSPAAVAAAIWALHPCKQASAHQPPALLAILGADERTAEVVCAACGQQVAECREAAAGRQLGMLMALQLFCAAPAGSPPPKAASPAAPLTDAAAGTEPASAVLQCAAAGARDAAGDAPAPVPPAPPHRILLAAGYEDGSVAVWRVGAVPGAPPVALRQLFSEPVMALAIDGAATGGAAGSAEERVVMFRLDLAACPARLSVRHSMEVRGKGRAGVGDVAVRPDRRVLATAGWDGRVRLFKYRSGRPLAVLKYHTAPVTGLRFAPRSMLLVTAARDGTLALWPLYQPADGGAA